jgi:hypothetical protein
VNDQSISNIAKWYEMFIAKPLFKLTATAIYLANDPVREKKWRIDQAPWSKENTEAFAGMHNMRKRILVVFDEAAAIDDHIWEVTEGALTDANTQILWLTIESAIPSCLGISSMEYLTAPTVKYPEVNQFFVLQIHHAE